MSNNTVIQLGRTRIAKIRVEEAILCTPVTEKPDPELIEKFMDLELEEMVLESLLEGGANAN